MTGLAGFAWFFYITVKGESVTFENASIAYQIPLLIGVVIMKYIILLANRFTFYSFSILFALTTSLLSIHLLLISLSSLLLYCNYTWSSLSPPHYLTTFW
jgi:hypothetical protein